MNYAKQITQLLLITLILSLGFGQLLRFELLGHPLYLHDLLVLTLLVINFRKVRIFALPLWFKLITLGLVIGALRALTLFPPSDLFLPLLYSLRLLAYLSLYLILRNSSFIVHRSSFIISGLIALTLGLAQYVFLPDMRVFQYLGWDDHLSRLTLPYFDPAFTAAMLGLLLLILLPLRSFVFRLLSVISSAAILLTYSRAIWLSLALTAFVFTKNKLSTLFVICLLLIGAYVALPRQFGEGTNLLRTYSITSRFDHDLQLAGKVGWNFVPGLGYNTLSLLSLSDSPYPDHAASFNNSFLTILATSGLLGLAGWLLFLKELYNSHPRLRPALTFVLLGSFFNNLLLYPFVLLWILLTNLNSEF